MKIIGLTGGIGSGKSTIAKWIEEKGVPVYNSDIASKHILDSSYSAQVEIIQLLGPEAFKNNIADKKFIAQKVFGNKILLEKLNAILHPAVQEDFLIWQSAQNHEIVIKEAAILFESGAYKQCDAIFTVTADLAIRIQRVMERDGLSEYEILERIKNQWPDERKIELSDFVLRNNDSLSHFKTEFEYTWQDIERRFL